MLHGMETGEERWQCGVPGMWDLGQLITAQSDPGKLLLALLLPSSPKHRRKVPREKELTKPEVTNDPMSFSVLNISQNKVKQYVRRI